MLLRLRWETYLQISALPELARSCSPTCPSPGGEICYTFTQLVTFTRRRKCILGKSADGRGKLYFHASSDSSCVVNLDFSANLRPQALTAVPFYSFSFATREFATFHPSKVASQDTFNGTCSSPHSYRSPRTLRRWESFSFPHLNTTDRLRGR